MKIVFCGPPHSGKSVFIANLIDKLPTDAYTIIRACPDGEGTWSNNRNQEETSLVRKKGKFTKTFIDDACQAIDNQTNKIVLVDVGGVMSKENEQVFKHCDSFVVLSSDEKKKQEWLEFGQRLGLECVGCLDSSLDGQEEIYSRTPYFQGRIVGLERGEILEDSGVIKAIVSDIVRKSKYGEKGENTDSAYSGIMIDDTELGFELGYGKEIPTEDGTLIRKVRWPESALPQIYKAMQEKLKPGQSVRLNGIRANFALCAICKAAKKQGVKDISAFDIRTKSYIPIKNLPKKRGIKQTEGLAFNIIENKENIFMDIDITKEQYSLEDYERCILPKIKEGKNLYLSGRMPLWLLASISSSYDSSRIFTFQPGKGFTCIASKDERDVGTVVDGVDGIDVNQYFEDKKDRSKTELPVVPQKNKILSKIKSMLSRFGGEKENLKYLDNEIRSTIVSQATPSGKSTFRADLESKSLGDTKPKKQIESPSIPNKKTHIIE